MTCVTRRFNGWILLPVVYSFSALLLAASASFPGATSPIWKRTPSYCRT
jgi:ABC-type uncharacterized transport system permease subunit